MTGDHELLTKLLFTIFCTFWLCISLSAVRSQHRWNALKRKRAAIAIIRMSCRRKASPVHFSRRRLRKMRRWKRRDCSRRRNDRWRWTQSKTTAVRRQRTDCWRRHAVPLRRLVRAWKGRRWRFQRTAEDLAMCWLTDAVSRRKVNSNLNLTTTSLG